MNHRLSRIIIACLVMVTIWQRHGMDETGWIGFAVCLFFVGAGDRAFPHHRVRALFYEIRAIYAEDAKRLAGKVSW
jgi:hypothetical protein